MTQVPTEGDDAVGTFLAGWYGPPTSVRSVASDSEPAALRKWRQTVARWDRQIVVQNQVAPRDRAQVEDDLVVFYVEKPRCLAVGVRRG